MDNASSKTIRFGVSLDADLLKTFDDLLSAKGYTNRSEAVRDLIRLSLTDEKWDEEDEAGGVLILVYDHHRNDLARKLTNTQHEFYDIITTSVHFHMDHANCLEIIALKGSPERLRNLSRRLISATGVKYGVFNPVPRGKEFK